jgi:uncharacterized protein (TIGR02284 family)
MENQRAIPILNDLLEINNDRIEGYKKALDGIDDSELKGVFIKNKDTSEKCKLELEYEILRCGEKPEEGTRATGKLFRAWMEIKTALSTKNRAAVLKLCEQGEDVAVSAYQDVLNNNPAEKLSLDQIDLVDRQYKMIKSDHDLIRSLRNEAVSMEK